MPRKVTCRHGGAQRAVLPSSRETRPRHGLHGHAFNLLSGLQQKPRDRYKDGQRSGQCAERFCRAGRSRGVGSLVGGVDPIQTDYVDEIAMPAAQQRPAGAFMSSVIVKMFERFVRKSTVLVPFELCFSHTSTFVPDAAIGGDAMRSWLS